MPITKVVRNCGSDHKVFRYWDEKKGCYNLQTVREAKGGWWQVAWVKKPKDLPPVIADYTSRHRAKTISDTLNKMSKRSAEMMVKELYIQGRDTNFKG